MVQTMPIVENAIKEVCTALVPETMVIADLGCSSGPNTLLFISNVINIIAGQCSKSIGECDPVELQIFLNDLPGNDFNQLFSSLEKLNQGTIVEQVGYTPPVYYISGLPKSYYNRLFPRRSVHVFHSACCLHWRSQVFLSTLIARSYLCMHSFVHGNFLAVLRSLEQCSEMQHTTGT